MITECLLACFLLGAVADVVKGQQLYSSEPQPYNIPPGRTIDEYKRQLEDDIYAVERKAQLVAQRECISGKESFYFCSLELNILDFLICIYNPALNAGSDAFIRGVKFPSSAFDSTPNVAVGISGIGTVIFGDVKIISKDVYASGFNIEITGGNFAYPYSLTVVWIACPPNYPLTPSVRDFVPKAVPPPPPYFPINEASKPSSYDQSSTSNDQQETSNYEEDQSTYSNKQSPYQDKDSKYEESSQSIDEEPSSYRKPPPYVQKPERYGQKSQSKGRTTPPYDKDPEPSTTSPSDYP